MPVQDSSRLAQHQFGRQSAFGTAVAATRAYPLKGVPENELNWTDPDVDDRFARSDLPAPPGGTGSDGIAERPAARLQRPSPDPVRASSAAGMPRPAAARPRRWTHRARFGRRRRARRVHLRVRRRRPDGLVPAPRRHPRVVRDHRPRRAGSRSRRHASWRFGHVASTGSTDSPASTARFRLPALNVRPTTALLYGKDLGIYIADTVAGLAAGQILDAFHGGDDPGSPRASTRSGTPTGPRTFDSLGLRARRRA